jgi:hypothetical protein
MDQIPSQGRVKLIPIVKHGHRKGRAFVQGSVDAPLFLADAIEILIRAHEQAAITDNRAGVGAALGA